MTTYIIGNLFLTTNEILIVNNHVFVKLLEYPHIKHPISDFSLLFLFFSFSLLCSLSRFASLSLSPICLSLPDLDGAGVLGGSPNCAGRRLDQRRSPSHEGFAWFAVARSLLVRRTNHVQPGVVGGWFVRRWFQRRPGVVRRLGVPAMWSGKKRNKKPNPNSNLRKKKKGRKKT